jgi:hypothetical protein
MQIPVHRLTVLTKWLHACEHVNNSIEQKFWKSDAIQEEIEKGSFLVMQIPVVH